MRRAIASAAKLLCSPSVLEASAISQKVLPGLPGYRSLSTSCPSWKPDAAGIPVISRHVATAIRAIDQTRSPSSFISEIVRQRQRPHGMPPPWQVGVLGSPSPSTLVSTSRLSIGGAFRPDRHQALPELRHRVRTTRWPPASRPTLRAMSSSSTPPAPGTRANPGAWSDTRARLAAAAGKEGASQRSTLALYLAALVVAMVGLTYASVPLYRLFCQATGFGGTVQKKQTVEQRIANEGRAAGVDATDATMSRRRRNMRDITVYFVANVADNMPWKFVPCQRSVTVKPNESTLAFYNATNLSDQDVNGVSTYNVSPTKAGQYFTKIQCFCFEEQRLLAGESVDMPVFFYIDPDFASDPKMDDVHDITLSYTFFRVEPDDSA